MNAPAAGQPVPSRAPSGECEPPREPWSRRLVRTLLYGRNVDRAAKTRARIGLAILVVFYRARGSMPCNESAMAALPRPGCCHRAAEAAALQPPRPDPTASLPPSR